VYLPDRTRGGLASSCRLPAKLQHNKQRLPLQ
jgi:hypothetical protein